MAKYKLQGSGVMDTETGAFIPNAPGNRHWKEYQQWLIDGNTPDPEFTQQEIDDAALLDRQNQRIINLRSALIYQFKMILALFQVGKSKGVWVNSDFDQELRDKASEWIQLINDYENEV